MPKTVEAVVKALKLRAEPKSKALTVRVGTKKHVLPFEVRIIASADYLFVHVPPSASLMKITGGNATPVATIADAQAAVTSFRKSAKKRTRKVTKVEMPTVLESALKSIPSGFKLTYGPDGKPKLVKTRKRTPKAASKTAKKSAVKPEAKTAAKAKRKPAAKSSARPAAKTKARAKAPAKARAKTVRKPVRRARSSSARAKK